MQNLPKIAHRPKNEAMTIICLKIPILHSNSQFPKNYWTIRIKMADEKKVTAPFNSKSLAVKISTK